MDGCYRHTPPKGDLRAGTAIGSTPTGSISPTQKATPLQCIEEAISRLKDYRSLDDSTVLVSIKYLVHLVGDMHCPVQ